MASGTKTTRLKPEKKMYFPSCPADGTAHLVSEGGRKSGRAGRDLSSWVLFSCLTDLSQWSVFKSGLVGRVLSPQVSDCSWMRLFLGIGVGWEGKGSFIVSPRLSLRVHVHGVAWWMRVLITCLRDGNAGSCSAASEDDATQKLFLTHTLCPICPSQEEKEREVRRHFLFSTVHTRKGRDNQNIT